MGQPRLLLLVYTRPVRAMSEIIDEGSLLFGFAGVIAVWLLTSAALYPLVAPAYAPFIPRAQPSAETLRLLKDYLGWESRPLLRRRGLQLLRQLERTLD